MEVKLYRREIRPIIHNCYCIYNSDTIAECRWFPESEEDMLKERYTPSDPYKSLVFEERYVDCGDRYLILKAEDYPQDKQE